MGVYDSQIALAERLISEKGKEVQLVRRTVVVPDPSKPWETGTSTEVITNVHAVFLNFNQKDLETQHRMYGEIEVGDRKVLIAAAATGGPISIKDVLRDGATEYTIEYVQVISPNGEDILYTARARK